MKVSIALPLYFASKDAHLDGIRVMLQVRAQMNYLPDTKGMSQ